MTEIMRKESNQNITEGRNYMDIQERTYKYVEPPVYHPGYALHKKPANAFQQRYYGKLYRMCVV